MGKTIDLNTEGFVFLDSFRFKTTEWCKARIMALALPDQIFNSSSCLSCLAIQSLVNATPRDLNFSACFNDTPPTCRQHWTGFLERCRTSILEVVIFISAMSQAAKNSFNARWRSDSEKASKTKSSVKSSRLILILPIVTIYWFH